MELCKSRAPYLDYNEGTLTDLMGFSPDQTVPVSQYGYVLGVPAEEDREWTSHYGCHGNKELDIDPHFTFFGCNTESEVFKLYATVLM